MNHRAALVTLVLLLPGCTSSPGGGATTGTATASGPVTAQTVTLQMRDSLTFVPNVINARTGALTITADNTGGIAHNLTFSQVGLGHTDTVPGHGTATLTVKFLLPGTYTFACTFHAGMTGRVSVRS